MNPNKLKNGFELAYSKNFNHLVNLYKTRFFDVCILYMSKLAKNGNATEKL